MRPSAEDSLVLDFDNNLLLSELYGAHGVHLARLEETLDVSVANRGNRVEIRGAQSACQRAEHVLQTLYARLQNGGRVGLGDIDGAVRLSKEMNNDMAKAQKNGADHRDGAMRIRTDRREIIARSPMQARYMQALTDAALVIGAGPAGTGKTYLAVAMAASALRAGQVDRLILSRPAVEAGERLGFLPGDMREKIDPYLRPLYDALYDMLSGADVHQGLESGAIEIAPLAFMRGRTLSNSFIILDEAQNASPMQMKMFLTRMGENSHMVITGDPSQVDLPRGTNSGLRDALEVLKDVQGVRIIRFGEEDVVRHDMVTRIVKAYARYENTLPLPLDKKARDA